MGASTCAFGNQRCNPYSGILTIKAVIHAYHISVLEVECSSVLISKKFVSMCMDPRL